MTTLLPGQAAAPEGPADLRMMYVMHHAFRRDLLHFRVAVGRTPAHDGDTWRALLARWDLFATQLHDHHHAEDEIVWPLLRGKVRAAGDGAAEQVLDAMEAEHAGIDPLLRDARAALASMVTGAGDQDRTAIAAVFDAADSSLCRHLAHEERDANAVLQGYVACDEWDLVERTQLRARLGPRDLMTMLPWAFKDLPDPMASELAAEAPMALRAILALGRRRFRRLDDAAFAAVPAGTVVHGYHLP